MSNVLRTCRNVFPAISAKGQPQGLPIVARIDHLAAKDVSGGWLETKKTAHSRHFSASHHFATLDPFRHDLLRLLGRKDGILLLDGIYELSSV
jgi:hypothetical protein